MKNFRPKTDFKKDDCTELPTPSRHFAFERKKYTFVQVDGICFRLIMDSGVSQRKNSIKACNPEAWSRSSVTVESHRDVGPI